MASLSSSMNPPATILVTGYIGVRLAPRLLEEGYRVRVLAPQRGTGALTFFSG